MHKKTSVFSNSLIWFGAGVSIAEILTGTLFAPLGFAKGIAAIIIGHIIGCSLMFFTGFIGGKTEKSSMETVKMSFGKNGSLLFSVLNVIQLIGWTGIMIINGGTAAHTALNIGGEWLWCIIIGALIILWISVGIKSLDKLNSIALVALFLLTIVMSGTIFKSGNGITAYYTSDTITFGAAVELSVAMPLSWLPLISDYTRNAKKPFAATLASSAAYFLASVWMYIIGMGAAIFTQETDISLIMLEAGLGTLGLIVVVLSTVTTTFLDAFSAGVSSVSIFPKAKEKAVAIIITVIGTLLAIFTPISKTEGFLYLIGSVFAPMIAIQLTDYYILKEAPAKNSSCIINLVIWFAGFIIYRMLMRTDTIVGYTLPAMLAVSILCIATSKITRR